MKKCCVKMHVDIICWYSFLVDAYKYSSNYLLLAIIIVIGSILCVWLHDRGNLHKITLNKSTITYLVAGVEDEGQNVTEKNIFEEQDMTSEIWPIKHDLKQQLMEKMGSEMTKEQMELEKEVEAKQLETIFKLLQEQNDKLQVSSMEQLKEQMKLYRK